MFIYIYNIYIFICNNPHTHYLLTFVKRQIFHGHFKGKVDKAEQLASGAIDSS